VILLTSPLSVLVRASLKHVDMNLVGICELPWTTLRQFSCSLGLEASDVECDYIGSNHFGWFYNIRSCGHELLDELATTERPFPASEFLRCHRCFPTRYLRLHYEADRVLAEQIAEKPRRAEALKDFQSRAYDAYESGQISEIKSALQSRATPWYNDAVGPLLLAVGGEDVDIPFFLSARNGDYVSFLARDDVIECRHQCADGKFVRPPLGGECPTHVIENLTRMVEFERAATDAIVARSPQLLESALAIHPWIRGHSKLGEIVRRIVSANEAIARD
jgi:6-phospho-beta-glucosidase